MEYVKQLSYLAYGSKTDEIKKKDEQINEFREIEKQFLEEKIILRENIEKYEKLLESEENYLNKAKEKAKTIVDDAKFEAKRLLLEAEIGIKQYRNETFLKRNIPEDKSEEVENLKKQNSNLGKSDDYFKKLHEKKGIPSELLKPKVDIKMLNNPLARKKVVITGDFEKNWRTDIAEDLWNLGADIDTSVGKSTNLLIIGKEPGEKKMEALSVYPNIETIDENELIRLLKIADEWTVEDTLKLAGKSFYVAGNLCHFTSPNLKLLIVDNGGKPVTRINKKVDYLILGDNPDYQIISEAENAGVTFMSEDDFIKLIDIPINIRELLES